MSNTMNEYWGREGLEQSILDALRAAGKDIDALNIDDLAPLDQYHGGGKGSTIRLARLAALTPGMRVLDVGGGLGGPARTLAAEFGCHVTVLDVTEPYVEAGKALTQRLGLDTLVDHKLGDALELPWDGSGFDAVWTQNSGMNIAAKERLYTGFYHALRPGGLLVLQEPMAGPVQPPMFPVMWATNPGDSFLRSPAEMRALIVAGGFRVREWQDITDVLAAGRSAPSHHSIQYLIMGDRLDTISLNGKRNDDEQRIVHIQAVFDRL